MKFDYANATSRFVVELYRNMPSLKMVLFSQQYFLSDIHPKCCILIFAMTSTY